MFQSTRLREARRMAGFGRDQFGKFQSTRLREARHIQRGITRKPKQVSIHAPA